jgi:Patatin-like phospholipase
MTHPARSALVLQGGGALGAFEPGAGRALYEKNLAPDVIGGVSIGAITAGLLARPAPGMTPLQALVAFWKTVPGELFPPLLRPYASFLGNRHFFTPRLDYLNWPNWTYLAFGVENGWNRVPAALANDDHDLALAVLVTGKAAVDALLFQVGGL